MYGIICIKNVIGYNINLQNNLLSFLKDYYEPEVSLKNLNSFFNIKSWVVSVLWKNVDKWEVDSSMFFLENQHQTYASFLDIAIFELNSYNNFRLKKKSIFLWRKGA